MLVIPTRPVPHQALRCVLAGQDCGIALYQKTTGLFMDLTVA